MSTTKGFRPGWAGRKVLAAFAFSLAFMLLAAPAQAGTSRGFEHGGKFTRFNPVVAHYNHTGAPFRIVGLCQSACTLFLSIRNVCVEPRATFQFHAGNDGKGNISVGASNHMLRAYNPKLRRFVIENGYLETFQFHTITGDDMIERFGYRACGPVQASDNEGTVQQRTGGEGSYIGSR